MWQDGSTHEMLPVAQLSLSAPDMLTCERWAKSVFFVNYFYIKIWLTDKLQARVFSTHFCSEGIKEGYCLRANDRQHLWPITSLNLKRKAHSLRKIVSATMGLTASQYSKTFPMQSQLVIIASVTFLKNQIVKYGAIWKTRVLHEPMLAMTSDW